jgi:acyl-coenzyme A thioesterase PaaI-like protein
MERALNEEMLPGNTCFGCGLDNPDGLQIRIFRDGARTDRLVGAFEPRPSTMGFPPIVHGGAQFTALDCMAAWIVFAFRASTPALPLTKAATMRYHRPMRIGTRIRLTSEVVREAPSPRDPIVIHTEIRDEESNLLTEADFDYILLPADRFLKATGLEQLPENIRRHFGVPS